ncbi:MAG: radical SAM protein [Tenericutes bacterium]|nr:radical SAM protein [Mycoplasmatota bacterium]
MKYNGLRFIVGSGCNLNCFYCHHEGYTGKEQLSYDQAKLNQIKDFCVNNNIYDIAITGGEPFVYHENLFMLLNTFNENDFKITLNTNAVLIDKYIHELKTYDEIEFHINFSSLNSEIHKTIVGQESLNKIKNNLSLLKDTNHKICLNIAAIKGMNEHELVDIFNYAIENSFVPRFLVLMTDDKSKMLNEQEILSKFPGAKILKKHSYGLMDIEYNNIFFQVVKCLCIDLECDICKDNTYMHITPEMNIKYCMLNDDSIGIDFNKIENSFEEAKKRLKLI